MEEELETPPTTCGLFSRDRTTQRGVETPETAINKQSRWRPLQRMNGMEWTAGKAGSSPMDDGFRVPFSLLSSDRRYRVLILLTTPHLSVLFVLAVISVLLVSVLP